MLTNNNIDDSNWTNILCHNKQTIVLTITENLNTIWRNNTDLQ